MLDQWQMMWVTGSARRWYVGVARSCSFDITESDFKGAINHSKLIRWTKRPWTLLTRRGDRIWSSCQNSSVPPVLRNFLIMWLEAWSLKAVLSYYFSPLAYWIGERYVVHCWVLRSACKSSWYQSGSYLWRVQEGLKCHNNSIQTSLCRSDKKIMTWIVNTNY